MQLFATLEDMTRSVLTFLWVMTLLVVVHELGHYLFARLFGMRIHAFAVFMGGIRKTDLSGYLSKKMLPKWSVAAMAAAGLAVLILGAKLNSPWISLVGLAVVGLGVPFWVGSRLGELYHVGALRGAVSSLWCVGGAVILTMITGKLSSFSPLQLVAVMSAGAWIGAIWTYYLPTRQKGDEEKMGVGNIDLDGTPLRVDFKPVWHWEHKGIEYSLLAMPLGGFVSIAGMQPKEDGSEANIPGGFMSKPAWQRFITLAAGPVFSVLLGVLLVFSGIFITGEPKATPTIDRMAVDSPAAKAGLKVDDKIVEVDGKPVRTFFDLTKSVRDSYTPDFKGVPVHLTVLRAGQSMAFTVIPEVTKEAEPLIDESGDVSPVKRRQARIGVGPKVEYVPIAADKALGRAIQTPYMTVVQTARAFSSFKEASENVGGTITIIRASGEVSKAGFGPTLVMAGLLSITLGIMNLLPIAPLDGGQMLIAFIEMLRGGKRLSYKIQAAAINIGMAILAVLVFSVLALDLGRAVGDKNPSPTNTRRP